MGSRVGYGWCPPTRKFTRRGAETLKEGAAVLSQWYGKQAVFLTGTIPGSTKEALLKFAEWSSYVQEKCSQWLRNQAPGCHYLWCFEFQKRGALHNHIVVACDDVYALATITEKWHEYWCHLMQVVSVKSATDLFGRKYGGSWNQEWDKVKTDAQWVVHDVGRYLSKYISKASCKASQKYYYNPARWWGMGKNLRTAVQEQRRTLSTCESTYIRASDWLAKLGANLAGAAAQVYKYENPVFRSDAAFIFFPAESPSDSLQIILAEFKHWVGGALTDLRAVADLFGGSLIQSSA